MFDYSKMTEREFLNKYFGSNANFPDDTGKHPHNTFEIESRSIRDVKEAEKYLKDLKARGFTTKKKSYSDFIVIKGIKRKEIQQ